jgi:hypothetical protein
MIMDDGPDGGTTATGRRGGDDGDGAGTTATGRSGVTA